MWCLRRGARLFSPESRGPESKFPHVSYGPWHVDITPAQRCGRPTAWTKAFQEGHSHASIAVIRLVDFERQGRRCRSQVQVRSMWKKQKVVSDGESEHNRAKYALRHTNFFSESDSQTAGLVPGSASSILTSLPPSFYDQRRIMAAYTLSRRVEKLLPGARIGWYMASYKHTSMRGVARLARAAYRWWWWRPPRT